MKIKLKKLLDKGITGEELGIVALKDLKRKLECKNTVFTKAEYTTLEKSLTNESDVAKYNDYLSFSGKIESLIYMTSSNLLIASKYILMLVDIVKDEFIKVKLSHYENSTPIPITNQQFNDLKNKVKAEGLKDTKVSVKTLYDMVQPIYVGDVEYNQPEDIPEIAIVLNPLKKNVDDKGYYKHISISDYFENNISVNKCKCIDSNYPGKLLNLIEMSLREIFAYCEEIRLISNLVNVDFLTIFDKYNRDLNYFVELYNVYLGMTIKFKESLHMINTEILKPTKEKINKAMKKLKEVKDLKEVNTEKIYKVLR